LDVSYPTVRNWARASQRIQDIEADFQVEAQTGSFTEAIQWKLDSAKKFRTASNAALMAEHEHLRGGHGREAQACANAAASNADKADSEEQGAVKLLENYRKLTAQQSAYIGEMIRSVVSQVLPEPVSRTAALRAIAEVFRLAELGKPATAPVADIYAVHMALRDWSLASVPPPPPQIDELELQRRIRARVDAAQAEWETELRRRISEQEKFIERRGQRVGPLNSIRVMIEDIPEPEPEAEPKAVAMYLKEEEEEGYDQPLDPSKPGEMYSTERKTLEERGPARTDRYVQRYNDEVYGAQASVFGF
jgi:hypothetical protein